MLSGFGYLQQMVAGTGQQLVAVVAEPDENSAPCFYLSDIVKRCLVDPIVDRDRDNWRFLVDQGDWSVLHLAGGIPFGVNVADLLELERTFQGDWIVDAPSEEQEISTFVVKVGDLPVGL